MTSNAKIVLRKKQNKQGLYPLAIRITKNRRSTYHYLGHYIDLKYWNEKDIRVKKSHPNAANLNNLLVKKLSEANKTLMNLQAEKQDISANRIKDKLYKGSNGSTFFEIAKAFLDELEANKKLARFYSDKVRVNHVLNFSKSNQLSFQEIDEKFLRNFKTHLKTKHGLSERSIVNNLVVIRTIYNRAIKLGIVDRKLYPFGSGGIQIKFPESQKSGLNKNELIALERVEGLTENEIHARNIWLFSFYLAGIRVADVLKIRWSDISDNRLNYRMNKNSKLLSLKIPEKALPILEHYSIHKQDDNDFIFPEMKMINIQSSQDVFRKINAATTMLNKYLARVAEKAKINKKVTMHIARHSFGTISEDKIPIKMLQKLYRHSSITTTINYQANFMHKDADEALENVINF
ncbi:phage integrase SAM-like domain-containing protein [Winogradskyella undariae]|uniref:site-specific integrase n=1 Tax=Winogradskyella undariae TaxID=1285465 RepID=UPI00156BAA7D|nr:site-specific integrase [Winogradskyella undariae]NRR90937.1 phage integrase SAM-like domain-containing protein [Winogradskyella undariae]